MHVDRDVGLMHLHLLVREGVAQHSTNLTVEVNAVDGIIRVGPAPVDLEGLERLTCLEALDSGLVVLFGLALAPVGNRHARNAGHARDELGNVSRDVLVLEVDAHVAGKTLNVGGTALEGSLEVGNELSLERRAVLALQANLVIMDEADS